MVAGCTGGTTDAGTPDMSTPDLSFPFMASCSNGALDGDETDVDCGGSCMACGTGKTCNGGKDCQSGLCANKQCLAPSCSDGIKNGDESDLDCGGSCPHKCAEGQKCGNGPDCQSANCVNNACSPSLCANKMKDGMETDVDCGGGVCPPCADGKMCANGPDCVSANCVNNVCKSNQMATCVDNVKNGSETDVDCGGGTCPKCGDGKGCGANGDCLNANCSNKLCCAVGMGHCGGGNACDTNVQSDVKNCGACGIACPPNKPSCLVGACAAQPNVLLIHTEVNGSAMLADVQQQLMATGAFAKIDGFNANLATPTVAKMQMYDVVLVVSNYPWADPQMLGDNLAMYFDGGGQVVTAVFSLAGAFAQYDIQGRFGDPKNGYIFLTPAVNEQTPDSLGALNEPNSPLLVNVKSLTAQNAIRGVGAVTNGGVVVAQWAGGRPLIIRGTVKGRARVDLNFYPVSSATNPKFWQGDGTSILRNALLYR